jgi:hypothetical protein
MQLHPDKICPCCLCNKIQIELESDVINTDKILLLLSSNIKRFTLEYFPDIHKELLEMLDILSLQKNDWQSELAIKNESLRFFIDMIRREVTDENFINKMKMKLEKKSIGVAYTFGEQNAWKIKEND